MKKKSGLLLILILFGLVAVLAACSNEAKDTENKPSYTLRYGHQHTETEPYHAAALAWAEKVAERTNGDVKIEVYPNGQLGSDEDMLEQMGVGTNLASLSDPARLGDYVSEFQVFYAPYFLENLDEVLALRDSDLVGEWKKRLEDQQGVRVLSFAYVQGYRNIFSNTKATSPEELKGVEIRTAGSPIWQASINSLGSTALSVPYGEVYNALQSGLVDGAELPYAAAVDFSIHEVADYILETQHIFQMNFLVVSSKWFNALPEEYQTILLDEVHNAGEEISKEIDNNAQELRQRLIDAGMEYVPYAEMNINAFKESGKQVYDSFKLNEVREAIYKEIGKQ